MCGLCLQLGPETYFPWKLSNRRSITECISSFCSCSKGTLHRGHSLPGKQQQTPSPSPLQNVATHSHSLRLARVEFRKLGELWSEGP